MSFMQSTVYRLGRLAPLLAFLACSANQTTRAGGTGGSTVGASGSTSTGGAVGFGGSSSTGGSGISVAGGNPGGQTSAAGACATAVSDAELTTQPVDILIVLDNSGSMHEEMG